MGSGMTGEGWMMLGLLVIGFIGGLWLWTRYGSRGGNDT